MNDFVAIYLLLFFLVFFNIQKLGSKNKQMGNTLDVAIFTVTLCHC